MNLTEFISNLYPDLSEKYNSDQYRLSEEIISKKLKLKLTQMEMSNLIGISFDKYLEMEDGSINIEVSHYQSVLDKLKEYEKLESELDLDSNLNIIKYHNFIFKIYKLDRIYIDENIFNDNIQSFDLKYKYKKYKYKKYKYEEPCFDIVKAKEESNSIFLLDEYMEFVKEGNCHEIKSNVHFNQLNGIEKNFDEFKMFDIERENMFLETA